ncbi:hypothetical protein NSE_0608 [Neorickettsia sennetsu str. Miyayama]|uniref:Uncharacterized protein n=1 Tax=Ehrlichia sennetsu (strain ATCC VR-367 / Miyayama) TaxID=222891 RepID=Q2GDF8_EHRS3|nr:hypothetical protein NSE_0608 [Neorickettsia sennetsu str. Miyayama]
MDALEASYSPPITGVAHDHTHVVYPINNTDSQIVQ